jgi:hypothetical protein
MFNAEEILLQICCQKLEMKNSQLFKKKTRYHQKILKTHVNATNSINAIYKIKLRQTVTVTE